MSAHNGGTQIPTLPPKSEKNPYGRPSLIPFHLSGPAGGPIPQEEPSLWAGLFRLTSETGAEDVANWMEEGILLPAPTEWIGGPERIPAGNRANVHVGDSAPGRYA